MPILTALAEMTGLDGILTVGAARIRLVRRIRIVLTRQMGPEYRVSLIRDDIGHVSSHHALQSRYGVPSKSIRFVPR